MKKIFEKFGVAIVISALELITYKLFNVENIYVFLVLWAILLIIVLIISIFDLFGGGVKPGYQIGNTSILNEMVEPPKQSKTMGGLINKGNLTLVLFIILNLTIAVLLVKLEII